ncbi:MAG: long-chain fatty acid--CoA ligase [Acetobacteraceae bacterium]
MTDPADTFPKLLLRNAALRGARPAMRLKEHGIWRTWSWAEVQDEVRALADGLASIGVARGHTVAIVGHNRPRLYWAFAAVQCLGAVPVPVYQDAIAEEIAYVLAHAETTVAIVQDQEQVDKLLAIEAELPALRHIVYDEERGLGDYDAMRLRSFAHVQDAGRAAPDPDWEAAWRAGNGADVAVVLYTSGTTGKPKGVMLSAAGLITTVTNANAHDRLGDTEEVLAYLPMAWGGDFLFSFAQAYAAGYCVCCPESPETAVADRVEIGPTYFFAPPRVFENQLTSIRVRMDDAPAPMRRMFDFFMGVASRWGERILNRETVPLGARALYACGRVLVYGPLKSRMGLDRLKVGYTAGEAIGPDMFRFYRGLGLNLKQLYGQTEASVLVTLQPDREARADTVGRPAPDVEIRIDPKGEVLFRGPGAFLGYLKDAASTDATRTPDGWVRTGDAGFIDGEGHLRILDRAKDVGRLADGTLFAPKYLENKLKFFPHIREAVAIGDGMATATVMLNIDLLAVGAWAERQGIVYASYQDLAARPEVHALLGRHVEAVNAALATEDGPLAALQIRRFLVLPKELDADDGELTRTQKVRRRFVAERYAPLIAALNDGSREAAIRIETVFEDGRRGQMHASVAIHDVGPAPAAARRRPEVVAA